MTTTHRKARGMKPRQSKVHYLVRDANGKECSPCCSYLYQSYGTYATDWSEVTCKSCLFNSPIKKPKKEGEMKPQTVRETLESLLEWRNVDGKTVLGDLTLDEAESALRELMEGVVPEKDGTGMYIGKIWDDCRELTLTNIARLFREKRCQ